MAKAATKVATKAGAEAKLSARPKAKTAKSAKTAKRPAPARGGATPVREPATADATLLRYLQPAFYARVAEPTPAWIAEVAATDAAVRINLVRQGIPAQAVASLADALDMSRDELTRELALPRATVERKLRNGGHLGQAESERVLGVVHLIAQVQRIVEESGDPVGFDAALWVAHWLLRRVPALGWRQPVEYMDTAEGRAIITQLVAQMQSGSYA